MQKIHRVTSEDVDGAIVRHEFFVTGTLTICVLFLRNGFTVTGESACVDPNMFNAVLGKDMAFKNAREKIWGLLGYALRDRMAKIERAPQMCGHIADLPGAATYLGTKVIHAAPMNRREYNSLRGWTVPRDENPDDEGYLVEYTDGGKPNVEGFTGYVSWSPKGVFDRAYGANPQPEPASSSLLNVMREPDFKPAPDKSTFLERMQAELHDLESRWQSLLNYTNGPDFLVVHPQDDQEDLLIQGSLMAKYADVLGRRLRRARVREAHAA